MNNFTETRVINSDDPTSCDIRTSVSLEDQNDVNAFPATLPKGCQNVAIDYDLYLGGDLTSESDISDLSPLGAIQSVKGKLIIAHTSNLKDLTGLKKLTNVGDDFVIAKNSNLTSLSGLNELHQVEGTLSIANNPQITSLIGMPKLTTVHNLSIEGNGQLNDLTWLPSFQSITGYLEVSSNLSLTSLNGFYVASKTMGSLAIVDNPKLTNIDALSRLSNVEKSINISDNDALTSLSSLENLKPLTDSDIPSKVLTIDYNKAGLSKLTDCKGVCNYLTWVNTLNTNNLTQQCESTIHTCWQ
ncbi:hypothetical protein [Parashewanella tropica]|uniref:hypothetical protein n=1 Tax=Parashewanella tropica TaxID=2547970 RepID=UPI001478350A|nr:hypothetical protein [Parashewanella tropica]